MEYPDYDPGLATPPLADDELDALESLLQALPGDAVMNVEGLDGYLTALAAGPRRASALKGAAWLPRVWGGDGEGPAPFASQKQRKKVVFWVLRHLHAIDQALAGPPEAWEPIVSVAETDDGEQVDAEDWCIGFLQAVALDPEAWAPLFDDPELGPRLVPIAVLGGEGGPEPDPAERDALSRAALDAVPALRAR